MKNLFVGNMSFQTSETDLQELFKPFGQVSRIHVAMDRETGRARGFAFVEMPNDEEAAKAIAGLDGKEVNGRNLKVNEARPKTPGGGPRSRWRRWAQPGWRLLQRGLQFCGAPAARAALVVLYPIASF